MRTIASERNLRSMSQDDLANKLGVSRPTISHWENGSLEPKASDLVTLSQLFGCSVDYLLGLSPNRV